MNFKRTPTLTPDQQEELARLKKYFPFRIVYGALSPSGAFEANAVANMRQPNKLSREGWTVFVVQ